MTRGVVLGAAAASLAAPAGALAMMGHGDMPAGPARTVSMGYASYDPEATTILVGDTVHWVNDSVRAHTVSARDGSFDAGRIETGASFDHTFATTGSIDYHCVLHAGMTGTVDVRAALLDAPRGAAAPGRPFPLSGRAAPGAAVTIQADSGSGFADVTAATAGPDGAFTTLLRPTASATYRAVTDAGASNAVALLVLDRRVTVTTRRLKGRDVVTATVTPSSPGSRMVLQLQIPERFGWWPVLRATLNARSQARFTVRTRRRLPARVRLTLPDGATALAESTVVHVGPVRRKK